MERNIEYVENSEDLKEGAKDLVRRSIETAKIVLGRKLSDEKLVHPGRKAQKLKVEKKS